MGYVVELEKGVWLVSALFEPKTTPKIKHARRYKSIYSAKVALAIAIKNTGDDALFPEHLIYDPEKQKLIEQARRIAENGCDNIKSCHTECLLSKDICSAGKLFNYKDSKPVAYAFLAGIAFEKGLL